jgi:hypothetical protein
MSMPPLSLEAANTAIRLDPGLLPPPESEVTFLYFRRNQNGMLRIGWVSGYKVVESFLPSVPFPGNEVFLKIRLKPNKISAYTPTMREHVFEIVALPENCPPIAEWLRIPDVAVS